MKFIQMKTVRVPAG